MSIAPKIPPFFHPIKNCHNQDHKKYTIIIKNTKTPNMFNYHVVVHTRISTHLCCFSKFSKALIVGLLLIVPVHRSATDNLLIFSPSPALVSRQAHRITTVISMPPCNTMPYHTILANTIQYHVIQNN